MKKEKRRQLILRRKNFLPSLVLTGILIVLLAQTVYFTSPNSGGAISLFFLLIFLIALFTFSLLLKNSRPGFLIAIGATTFLFFRMYGIGNILNLILIISILVVIEIYARFKKQS